MLKIQPSKRVNVTVDDRRAIMSMALSRPLKDIALVPHEAFVRKSLKTRRGWSPTEPAPEAVKEAAKQMGVFLVKNSIEKAAALKAKIEKASKEKVPA